MEPKNNKDTYLKKIFMWCCLVLISVSFVIVAAEGFVRIRQYFKHGHTGNVNSLFYRDPSLNLRVLNPNITQKNMQTNSMGFRSPELVSSKPDSTIRLAFLGASTTFCAEISENELTWPHLVVKLLRQEKKNTKFDYLNAAVPGYTVDHSLKILKHRVRLLFPDIIVIYHATNDLSRNTKKLAISQGLIDRGPVNKSSWLSKHSSLWFLLEKNITIWMRQENNKKEKEKLDFAENNFLASEFKGSLVKLITESQKIAKLVVIATFSKKLRKEQTFEEQLKASNTSFYYMPYMSIQGLLKGFEEYNKAIIAAAKETGALLVENENSIPGDYIHFNDSVHFKIEGSKLMAKRISDSLLKDKTFNLITKKVR